MKKGPPEKDKREKKPSPGGAMDWAPVLAASREPLAILDPDLTVVAANPAFCQWVGQPAASGRPLLSLGSGSWNVPGLEEDLRRLASGEAVFPEADLPSPGSGQTLKARVRRVEGPEGRRLLLSLSCEVPGEGVSWDGDRTPTTDELSRLLSGEAPSSSDREREMTRLDRSLSFLSACNRAMTAATDEETLLSDICRLITEKGRYPFAWVGFSSPVTGKIVPRAQHGLGKGGLPELASWLMASADHPAARAAGRGETLVWPDPEGRASWPGPFLSMAFSASASLPLAPGNRLPGSLNIHSREPRPFCPEEIRLLTEVAVDLAFGIHALRNALDRDRTRDTLGRERDQNTRIMDICPVAIVVVNHQGRLVYANRTSEEILGARREDLVKARYNDEAWQATDHEGRPLSPGEFPVARVLSENRAVQNVPMAIRRKNGETAYLLVNGAPLATAGCPPLVVTAAKDVTAMVVNQKREEHLNRVLEAVRGVNQLLVRESDPGRLADGACRCLVESRGFQLAWIARLAPFRSGEQRGRFLGLHGAGDFGKGYEKLAGRLSSGWLPPCAEKVLASGAGVWENDPAGCGDCPVRLPGPGFGVLCALLEQAGHVHGMLCVRMAAEFAANEHEKGLIHEAACDVGLGLHRIWIEERGKTTEGKLKKSQARYRFLVERMNEGLVLLDPDHRVTFANLAFTRLVGHRESQLLGTPLTDLADPESREAILGQLMAGNGIKAPAAGGNGHDGSSLRAPVRFVRVDGRTVPALVSATPLAPENGDPSGSLLVVTDVTDLELARSETRKLEAHLMHAQQLEALGTLAGGIAHDFNNILTAIMGYTELSMDAAEENSDLSLNLQEVYRAGGRARDLVRQILAFSRQVDHRKEPMNPAPIVKEALKFLRASLPSFIEIRSDIPANPGMVLADPSRFHQVVMNLCTNAGHAMRDQGGVLSVSLQARELSPKDPDAPAGLAPGQYLALAVADTGTGMAPEIVERIFEPYFTTKQKGEGTGLGLAMVHGIVTSHGGDIRVQSEPGKGTRMEVFLPLVEAGEPAIQEEAALELPVGGRERVLLVDDEPAIADLQKKFLEKLGYHVTAFTESTRALEAFCREPDAFDLVVTDRTMPKITGDRLAEKIHAMRPQVPVILCTGFSEAPEGEEVSDAIRQVLLKPVGIRDLARALRDALDGGKDQG